MTKKEKEAQRLEAVAFLKKYLKAGDRVYTVLNHVSSSGMSRRISVIIPTIKGDDELGIFNITGWVAQALGYKCEANKNGMKVGGYGMDMGFHVVYSLGSALWGHGKDSEAPKQNYETFRNGVIGPETDGGYLLRQIWV